MYWMLECSLALISGSALALEVPYQLGSNRETSHSRNGVVCVKGNVSVLLSLSLSGVNTGGVGSYIYDDPEAEAQQ